MQIKFFVWLLQRTLLTGRTDVLFRAGEEGSQVPRWRSGGGRAAAVTMEEWGCRASCWHVDGRQLEHCTRQGNRPRSKRASEGSGNNCSCRALFWTVRSRSHGGEYETTWPNERKRADGADFVTQRLCLVRITFRWRNHRKTFTFKGSFSFHKKLLINWSDPPFIICLYIDCPEKNSLFFNDQMNLSGWSTS